MPKKTDLGKVFHKVNLDFQVIETNDPLYLTVADYSEWGGIEDKIAAIEVILPADTDTQSFYFDKKSLNVFNSNTLGLTSMPSCGDKNLADLPDGLYKLKLVGSPDKYFKKRRYLRTTKMQSEIDQMLIKYVNSCDEVSKFFIDKVCEVNVLIQAAKANVRYDNICEANALFFKAQDIVKNQLRPCKKCDK